MSNYGNISRLQHFSTGDGDGIRSTVFLQGCNLFCKWCHNPETQDCRGSVMVYPNLCTKCGRCASLCGAHLFGEKHKIQPEKCSLCGKCEEVCLNRAIFMSGKRMSAEEVFSFIAEDKDYYDISGGGVTFSGGEPLLQADFVAEVAAKCKEKGISVYVDTALCVSFSEAEKVLACTDKFLVDLKSPDAEALKKMTGADLSLILKNLNNLWECADVCVRIPVIPGFNDSKECMQKYAKLLGGREAELLPFHRLGSGKYAALGRHYDYEECVPPCKEQTDKYISYLKSEGVNVK